MQREMLVLSSFFLFLNETSRPGDYLLCDLRLEGVKKVCCCFVLFLCCFVCSNIKWIDEYYLKRNQHFCRSYFSGQMIEVNDFKFCPSGANVFASLLLKSPVHWLTQYLCNDRKTVLECVWVGRMGGIHNAACGAKSEKCFLGWGGITISSH